MPPRKSGTECPRREAQNLFARAGVIRSRHIATLELGLIRPSKRRCAMAMFVGLDVSLRTTSICIVEGDGSLVGKGKSKVSQPRW